MPKRMAMTRYSVCDAILVAHPAPHHAPKRLPAKRLTMIVQCAAMTEKGTVAARNGNADVTTTRLMALLRITACKAANRKTPISSGNRNSAPPRPIRPPRAPIIAPLAKAADVLRIADGGRVVVGMTAPDAMSAKTYRSAPSARYGHRSAPRRSRRRLRPNPRAAPRPSASRSGPSKCRTGGRRVPSTC